MSEPVQGVEHADINTLELTDKGKKEEKQTPRA